MLGFVVLVVFVTLSYSYICQHEPLRSEEVSFGFVGGKNEVNPSLVTLVFHLDDTFTDKKLDRIVTAEILNEVKDWFNSKVFVKIPSNTIHLARSCPGSGNGYSHCTGQCADISSCGTATIPDSHLGKCYVCISQGKRCGFSVGTTIGAGVTADVIIYLTSRDVAECNVDAVQASACQLSPHDNRPIAGYLNICPSFSLPSSDITNIIKHQLFHVLGVSKVLYPYYRASNGTPLTERDENGVPLNKDSSSSSSSPTSSSPISTTFIQWSNVDGMTSLEQKVLRNDNTRAVVKDHYDCNDPEGLLLENQDPHFSHIEERVARGEGMTVNVTDESVFSKLSFSFLDDTGWYITGDIVEPVFGKGLGCDFLSTNCAVWVEQGKKQFENLYPFCDQTNAMSCDSHYRRVVKCQSKAYAIGGIPSIYTYNKQQGDVIYGGESVYSDYCMSFEVAGTCNVATGSIFLERFGEHSVCMRHEGPWIRHGASHDHGAGCYEVCCRDKSYDVISATNQVHSCYHNKQTIHLSSSDKNTRGSLTCAPLDKICTKDSNMCPSPGKCETPPMINGQVYGSQGMYQITIGTTLSFVCFDGYIMRGHSSTVCLGNNKYSTKLPQCKIRCTFPDIPHSTFEYSSSQTLLGDVITVKCASDYTLTGSGVLKCSQGSGHAGIWSPDLPSCVQQYLAWSDWGPCSGQCGQMGMKIRTRGCSTCKDFEWEETTCSGSGLCKTAADTGGNSQNRSDLLIFGIFAGIVILLMLVIVLVIAYLNYKNNQRTDRSKSVFNESFYSVKKPVPSLRRNLSDFSSEYSEASGSMKQLFSAESPPTSPFYVDGRQKSKLTLAAIQAHEDPVIEIKYKEAARALPRNRVSSAQDHSHTYKRWKSAVDPSDITESPEISESSFPPSYEDAFLHKNVVDENPEEKMRDSIRAAKLKLQNNRSLKRLSSIHEGKIMSKIGSSSSVSDVEIPEVDPVLKSGLLVVKDAPTTTADPSAITKCDNVITNILPAENMNNKQKEEENFVIINPSSREEASFVDYSSSDRVIEVGKNVSLPPLRKWQSSPVNHGLLEKDDEFIPLDQHETM